MRHTDSGGDLVAAVWLMSPLLHRDAGVIGEEAGRRPRGGGVSGAPGVWVLQTERGGQVAQGKE